MMADTKEAKYRRVGDTWEKQCTLCRNWFPTGQGHFPPNNTNRFGLGVKHYCNTCDAAREYRKRMKNKLPSFESVDDPDPFNLIYFIEVIKLNEERRAKWLRDSRIALSLKVGLIKIGYSVDPRQRRDQLCTLGVDLTLLGIVQGGFITEQYLHRRFADYRYVGEWFEPSPELFQFIGQYAGSYLK